MTIPWHDMFFLSLPIAEILRPIIIYIFLIVGLRVAGKRELAQLNPFDLVVLLTLSNTVQNAIIGDDNSVTGGIIGASTLLLANYFTVKFLYHHQGLEALVEGRRDFLICKGQVLNKHLQREMMTRAELTAAAHRQGMGSLAEVEAAVLEPTGVITFIAKTPSTEDTRHHEIMDTLDHLRLQIEKLTKPNPPAPAAR